MTNYKNLLWSLAAIPLLVSCSQDELADGSGNGFIDPSEGVYMQVGFSLNNNAGTRSFTDGDNSSNDGVEIGTEAENKVNSALIVLAAPGSNTYIASSLIDNTKLNELNASSQTIYQANAKFSKTSLSQYYTSPSFSREVNVFVYCNPTSALKDIFKGPEVATDWTDAVENTPNSLWNSTSGFLMSNVSMETRTLPATMDDWNAYTTEATAFDLSGMNHAGQPGEVDNQTGRGAIKVHRAAARFDFKDGSPLAGDNGEEEGQPFTYNVVLDKENNTLVQVKLTTMALVNMSKSEYYLERVSSNGFNDGATLLGAELPWYTDANGKPIVGKEGNYVVSTNADSKKGLTTGFDTYYQYPFFNNDGVVQSRGNGWDAIRLDQLVNGDPNDKWGEKSSYYVWRYVSENTIPGEPSGQVNGVSTGIVFKGKMIATDNLKDSSDKWEVMLYNALNEDSEDGIKLGNSETDPILYSFAGNLYVTWANVQAAALKAAGYDETKGQNQQLDRSASLYIACYGNGGVGVVKNDAGDVVYDDTNILKADPNSANSAWTAWNAAGKPSSGDVYTTCKSKITGANFTIYQSSKDDTDGWGYYCYYYYWNRHNDNGQNGVMGPMEFGVVRNNVYKLAVTRLSQLGHPRIPENDPDTPTPDTPDEKSDIYMTVSVRVVPWVVRVNNIEF